MLAPGLCLLLLLLAMLLVLLPLLLLFLCLTFLLLRLLVWLLLRLTLSLLLLPSVCLLLSWVPRVPAHGAHLALSSLLACLRSTFSTACAALAMVLRKGWSTQAEGLVQAHVRVRHLCHMGNGNHSPSSAVGHHSLCKCSSGKSQKSAAVLWMCAGR